MNATGRAVFLSIILVILLFTLVSAVSSMFGITPAEVGLQPSVSVYVSSRTINVPAYYSDGHQGVAFNLPDGSGTFLATAITQDGRYALVEIDAVEIHEEIHYNEAFWVETKNLLVWNDNDWRRMSDEVDRDLGLPIH